MLQRQVSGRRRIGNGPHVGNTETPKHFLPTRCIKLRMRSPNELPYPTERYMQIPSGIPVPMLNCELKTNRTRSVYPLYSDISLHTSRVAQLV
jgi:hypothetical protein